MICLATLASQPTSGALNGDDVTVAGGSRLPLMTPNDFEHYKVKGTPYTRSLFSRVEHVTLLYEKPFSTYKVVENRKSTE